MALALKLRNDIYQQLFTTSQVWIISLVSGCFIEHTLSGAPRSPGLPALLLASKQVRQEATWIFFANVAAVASQMLSLKLWLVGIDIKYRRTITRVRLDSAGSHVRHLSENGMVLWRALKYNHAKVDLN